MKRFAGIFGLAVLVLLAASSASAQYYTAFGQNKIVYDKFPWKTYRSTHFVIYFYEDTTLQRIASYAESAYDDISRALNYQIPQPINLITYASHADFEQTNTILNFIPEGVGAFALPSRNRMVLPIDMSDTKLQELIAHELTHVFQFEIIFGGNYLRAATGGRPQWFFEGMASYFGKDEDNKDKMVLRDAVLSDRIPQVAQGGPSGFFAYRFGHAVFDFIEKEWGKDAVREFVFEFRSLFGGNIDKIVNRTFNVTAEEFDLRFRKFLRQRYLKELVERGEPTDFGEKFRVSDDGGSSAELSPVVYPSGDFYAAISTSRNDADLVLVSVRDRKLYRNLTKGLTTEYEYLIAQWITTGPQGGRDISVSPDGNYLAIFARRERGRSLLLLNALTGSIEEWIDMPGLDQQLNPAFSPDGRSIVFRAFQHGQCDLFTYDRESKTFTKLTNDGSYDFAPTFSPDGEWLYYSAISDAETKIYRLRPKSPDQVEQVTYGKGNDEDPAISPDGKRLFFTSDREGGIFNIYSLDLTTGEIQMHTNVTGGAFAPTVGIGRGGAEYLGFGAYYKQEFSLYYTASKNIVKKVEGLEPAPSPIGPGGPPAFQPAIEVSVDPEKVEPKISRKLTLEDAQVLVGVNTDQTFLSNTLLVFGDNLGDRRLIINLQSVSSFTDFDIQYWDLTKRMQKGLRAVDQRLYYIGVDQSTGFIERSEEAYRYTGIEGIVSYPLDRYRRVEGGLGYLWTHTNSPFAVQAPGGGPNDYLYFVEEVEPNFPLIRGAFIQDSAIYSSFGPYKGIRWRLEGNYAPDFNKDIVLPPTEEVTSTLSMGASIDFRAYVPISQRMLFAFRAFGASATGNIPQFWYYGGLDTVRGLDYASKYGNTVAFTNLEFRFPLIDLLALPILGVQGIRGRIFLDVGFAELRGQNLDVWDSEENRLVVDLNSPTGAVAAYGWGFRINFLGLPLNWDFVRLYDFKNSLSGWESSFYIGPNF